MEEKCVEYKETITLHAASASSNLKWEPLEFVTRPLDRVTWGKSPPHRCNCVLSSDSPSDMVVIHLT